MGLVQKQLQTKKKWISHEVRYEWFLLLSLLDVLWYLNFGIRFFPSVRRKSVFAMHDWNSRLVRNIENPIEFTSLLLFQKSCTLDQFIRKQLKVRHHPWLKFEKRKKKVENLKRGNLKGWKKKGSTDCTTIKIWFLVFSRRTTSCSIPIHWEA